MSEPSEPKKGGLWKFVMIGLAVVLLFWVFSEFPNTPAEKCEAAQREISRLERKPATRSNVNKLADPLARKMQHCKTEK